MGLFGKMKSLSGKPDAELMKNGLLGRGIVTSVEKTSVTVGQDWDPHPVCIFGLEVTLDNTPAYQAECRQSVPLTTLPQFTPGSTIVTVRVDPTDHTKVALDLATPTPEVTMASGSGKATAASILADGVPIRAVIIQSEPLSAKNASGVPLYAFVLTILQDGQPPRQTQVGNPVPDDAVPLLYPGSNLPAKVSADDPKAVAIDWAAALAESSKGSAPA